MTSDTMRRQYRQVWFVLIVVVVLQAIALTGGAIVLVNERDRVDAATARLAFSEESRVQVVLNGCQAGNELRRAVEELARIQTNRAALTPRIRPPQIDEDAFTIVGCRVRVIDSTGIDPGDVPDYVP